MALRHNEGEVNRFTTIFDNSKKPHVGNVDLAPELWTHRQPSCHIKFN